MCRLVVLRPGWGPTMGPTPGRDIGRQALSRDGGRACKLGGEGGQFSSVAARGEGARGARIGLQKLSGVAGWGGTQDLSGEGLGG